MLQRNRLQTPVQMVGPAVIAALKLVGSPLVEGDHHGAAVRALIVQDVQRPIGAAHDDDGFAPDLRAEIIARLPDLALVADVDPCGAEDALEFELENRRIVVEPAMHRGRLHQTRDVYRHLLLHMRT